MEIVFNTNKEGISKPTMELVEKEKIEYRLLGKYQLTPGLNLYSYNPDNGLVLRVHRIKRDLLMGAFGNGKSDQEYSSEEALVDSRLIYSESLNNGNAVKRVIKYKQGKLKELSNLKEPKKGKIKLW